MNPSKEATTSNAEKEMRSGAVALFDVDNTLIGEESKSYFSILLFAEFLNGINLFDSIALDLMRSDFTSYEQGELDYISFAVSIVDHYSLGLQDLSEQSVTKGAEAFLPQYQQKLFPYSKELVDLMKQQGELIVISGAPREAFLPLASVLGMNQDQLYLLEAETKDGRYTGKTKVNMALKEEKTKVIQKLSVAGFNRSLSFAFGDSSQDLPLLQAVENPFAVGNNPALLEEARQGKLKMVNGSNIIIAVKQRITELKSTI